MIRRIHYQYRDDFKPDGMILRFNGNCLFLDEFHVIKGLCLDLWYVMFAPNEYNVNNDADLRQHIISRITDRLDNIKFPRGKRAIRLKQAIPGESKFTRSTYLTAVSTSNFTTPHGSN